MRSKRDNTFTNPEKYMELRLHPQLIYISHVDIILYRPHTNTIIVYYIILTTATQWHLPS